MRVDPARVISSSIGTNRTTGLSETRRSSNRRKSFPEKGTMGKCRLGMWIMRDNETTKDSAEAEYRPIPPTRAGLFSGTITQNRRFDNNQENNLHGICVHIIRTILPKLIRRKRR